MSSNTYNVVAFDSDDASGSAACSGLRCQRCSAASVIGVDRYDQEECSNLQTNTYRHPFRLHRLQRLLMTRHSLHSSTTDIIQNSTIQDSISEDDDISQQTNNSSTNSSTESTMSSGYPLGDAAVADDPLVDKDMPCMYQLQVIADRTAALSEHAMRALLFDILPWVLGCYIIFFTFRNGGLGLGFTAFLLLVSAHGVLKWWTTRGGEEPSSQEENQDTSESALHHHHHHHHHHHLHSDDSEQSYTSDEADEEDMENKAMVYEPPPSYDVITNQNCLDPCFGLEVHLTPGDSRQQMDPSNVNSDTSKHLLMNNTTATRRDSVMSTTSYMSSEVDDESLPSYTEAVKKIKKKKRKINRNRSSRSDNRHQSDIDVMIPARNRDIIEVETLTKDAVDVRILMPSSEDRDNSSSPALFSTVISPSASVIDITVSDTGYVPYRENIRINTTDSNSILSLELTDTDLNEHKPSN